MALIGQRAENNWVGMNSGVMDQLICATGRAGHARLIDCRDLSGTDVPLIDGTAVVLLDTGTRRTLVDSEYNARRSDCETAAQALGVEFLRDATARDGGGRRVGGAPCPSGPSRGRREPSNRCRRRRTRSGRRRHARSTHEREPCQLARRLRGVLICARRHGTNCPINAGLLRGSPDRRRLRRVVRCPRRRRGGRRVR